MSTLVVTTSPSFGMVGRIPEQLRLRGWNFIRCVDVSQKDSGIWDQLDKVEYLVVGLVPATAEMMDKAPQLKGIIKHGVGIDNIDLAAATQRKIPVLNTPGANANAVAELAVGGMLGLARHIPQAHKALCEGKWQRQVGSELSGKTLGIVGFGNIGKLLAVKARALGMKVLATDLYPDAAFAAEHQVRMTDLDALLAESDYVSLHIFGGKENTNLFNAAKLALLKPTACLLNYARGEILDLDALNAALEHKALRGAAIDAYTSEPPDYSHPIFRNPAVIFTPHSGADTTESIERMGDMCLEGIESLMAGTRPRFIRNPEIYG